MYEEMDQRLRTIASEAEWKASTDVNDQNTGQRIGAARALAAFQGSRYVIGHSRRFLSQRASLSDVEFRELDKILLNAAESPATIPDVVRTRIETEARLSAALDGFTYCLESRGGRCVKPITPNQIDDALESSRDLRERLRVWETSKQAGPDLKQGLAEVRDLRNRVATELGYTSYFHLQVADYGMSVAEMMQLMDKILADAGPLYEQLHLYARRQLAKRYKQPVPDEIPAHWLPNRWGQEWPGLAQDVNLDDLFRDKKPEWIVQQAERFYTSLGWPPLPRSFWEKSDLYQLAPGSKRKKSPQASAWHIDLDQDVRCLMSVMPDFRWFETSHHELGHIYYYLAYSNPRVPVVLREGANRAFHEAVGDLIAMAARQGPHLQEIGLLPRGRQMDRMQSLLNEALDGAVVFLPFGAGVMTHFEQELYEKKLPADQFNRRWWELVRRYQRIQPPSPRGEEYCDACANAHIIEDPAQYYDDVLASLIRYQLHDHIARQILHQDPHNCSYYGNKEVGRWLWEILSLGATRDWRQVIREKTGEEISTRAMVQYFQPLVQYLETAGSTAR
jgi:peptidyl-dipeptidase A